MKYKYYFRKPRSEIVKDILGWLVLAGGVIIAATSPYFIINLMRSHSRKWQGYRKRNVSSAFQRLQRQNCLKIETRNHQIFISLTDKGKRMADWLQIDALKVKRPKKWDKRWRILIFDIAQLKKRHREALRGKLKELGFRRLQKSVWIYPFDCSDEIELLREFFDLSQGEMRLIVAQDIGSDAWLRKIFKI